MHMFQSNIKHLFRKLRKKYASPYELLFQVDEKPSLLKVDDLENKNVPCVNATFTANNTQFITAPNTGGLFVYDIKYERVSISQTLESPGQYKICRRMFPLLNQ